MIEECINKILNSSFLSYEITPPKGVGFNEEVINELKQWSGFDALVCTDAPLAKLKQSSILTSLKLQNILQKPVICTLNMRDRNSIALQGDILGVNDLDVRMFLALSGDPIKLGDHPNAKGVFEGNSNLLLEMIENLNHQKDFNHNPIQTKIQKIYPFSVINAYSNNLVSLKNKMRKKILSGAQAFFTQPVFDIENAKTLIGYLDELNAELGTKIALILGYFPVMKYKTAHFLYSRLPGVFIPEIWLEKLEIASKTTPLEEEKVGFELSKTLYDNLRSLHNKIHFMNSNKISLAKKIIN